MTETTAPPPADLVALTGGRVIDPANGIDEIADVVCGDGRILAVGPGAAAGYPTAELINCTNLLVTPGLIDVHVHVYPGLGNFCVTPDQSGVDRGVPIVVDGGTSGTATMQLALDWLDAAQPKTKVLSFMDPCVLYLATHDFICHKLEIANDTRNLDLDAAAELLELHADRIVGFKVRACHTGDPDVSPFLEGAKSIAGDRPIMVHLGRFPHTASITTDALLGSLRGGDIITHAFRGASGALTIPQRLPSDNFRAAADRGVRLDVGHSATDFRFRDARTIIEAGYVPDTISTDMNRFNIDHPVGSLAETMSKILALGCSLSDVVAMTTINAATSIHRTDEYGTLDVGRSAEVSVMRLESGPAELSDGYETVVADERLVPVGCLRAGEWIAATAGMTHAAAA
jgi:dihydroorotase